MKPSSQWPGGPSSNGGAHGRDRYKAQYRSSSVRSSSGGVGRDDGGSDSIADRLVQRYHDSTSVANTYARNYHQQVQSSHDSYDNIDSKIHGRRRDVPEELWPWWRRRKRSLIFLAYALFLVVIIPRRRKMRIKFPGMPGLRRRQAAAARENEHIIQRQEVREEDRPRAHKARRKKHRKSGFQRLHLRVPTDAEKEADGMEWEIDMDGGEEADGMESELDFDGGEERAADAIAAVVEEMRDKTSPEQNPNDPDAPPIFRMSHFKDTSEPYSKTDVPVFWHVPKSGGSTIKDVAGSCHRLITASNVGTTEGHWNDTSLQIVRPGGSMFVNIDAHSVEGIQHAKEIGFPTSGMAEIIVTTLIREANDLGSPSHMLRFFGVFRHPIERAISMFYYIQVANWEKTYHPELKNWTIEEYALSNRAENNWMTRQLANNPTAELEDGDLEIAMEVLRRKFFIGLIDKMEESMDRFERFFRWSYRVNPHNQEACRERLLTGGGGSNRNVNATKKTHPKEGTKGWELLAEKNQYDLQLYEYARELFEQQENLLDVSHPKGYRRIKETCCKCSPPTYPVGGYNCP